MTEAIGEILHVHVYAGTLKLRMFGIIEDRNNNQDGLFYYAVHIIIKVRIYVHTYFASAAWYSMRHQEKVR